MNLWHYPFTVPFNYSGDAKTCLMYVKTMIDHGWYTHNSHIGTPSEWCLYDFPALHTLDFLIMKVIAFFSNNYAIVANAYYLLTFPLIAVCSIYALRQMKFSYPSAIVASLIFSIVPFHFRRGMGHLFLSSYYVVPLAVMLAYRVSHAGSRNPDPDVMFEFSTKRREITITNVLSCVLIALSHIYFIFFSLYLIIVSGFSFALSRKSRAPILAALLLVTIIGLVTAANHGPVYLYRLNHGVNQEVAARNPVQSLRHGLSFSSLIIPRSGYVGWILPNLWKVHVKAFARIGLKANSGNYIGVVGICGIIVLLGSLSRVPAKDQKDDRLHRLSIFFIWVLLLGGVAGIGYLFSLMVSPLIRAYDRVSIFLSFFAISAIILTLETRIDKIRGIRFRSLLRIVVFTGCLLIAIADQTVPNYLTGVKSTLSPIYFAREVREDREFVERIENTLPEGSRVLQLPHIPWPEGGKIKKMESYDHFAGYLNSNTLRWSFGAVKGRETDTLLKDIIRKHPLDLLESIYRMGFRGIYIDRYGFTDSGAKFEEYLTRILNQEPLVSNDGRRSFFHLLDFGKGSARTREDPS